MWTRIFWIDAADRAARTFAQALLATITIGDAVYSVDWALQSPQLSHPF